MITMEDWVTIRNLKKRNPRLGTRKIANLLGINRNTVKRALSGDGPPVYTRSDKINPEIEPFKEFIYESYVVKNLRGSRVLEDMRSKGFRGSQSAFYRHLVTLSKSGKNVFMPYETAPGEQGQFDWSPYTVEIGGIVVKVVVFCYILGFSRYRVYEASLSETQGCVFEAMENSFIESDGVPSRVQTDNARCFVDNASKENFQWNKRYIHFCGHYGFKPSRSLPGHPWSKGKVENPFDYLENHFIKERKFESFEDFTSKLKEFQDTVNSRVHQSTRAIPKVLFEKEVSSLLPLPSDRYIGVKEDVRNVTGDCLISFNGSRYSVPWMFARKQVWIRVSKGYKLLVYSMSNRLIAGHMLSTIKGKVVISENHYRGYRKDKTNWHMLCQRFLERFPEKERFLDKLKAQKRINYCHNLNKIIDIIQYYSDTDVLKTIDACFEYNTFSYLFFDGYLQNHFSRKVEVRAGSMGSSVKRSLMYYSVKGGDKHATD